MAVSTPWAPRVAVIEFYETIRGGARAARYIKLFGELRKNKRVRAVVLDIDSPGGSAAASEYLHQAATQLAADKPVVAFIRGIGASGGYMLACAGSPIVALPGSIIGSIGVISLRPIAQELLTRVGLQVAVTKSGLFKDSGAFYRLPTDEEQRKDQEIVDDYFAAFVDLVAQSRRLPAETVRQYATGEIFTGRRAQSVGLVDELGTLETAIERAAALAGIAPKPMTIAPPRPLPARILARASAAAVEAMIDGVESRLLHLK